MPGGSPGGAAVVCATRSSDTEITVYKSVGVRVHDAAAAALVSAAAAAQSAGSGHPFARSPAHAG
jgi:ornithine cyclodeaminase/alanine dehydrogenase-like protein (mu-crystallin family)